MIVRNLSNSLEFGTARRCRATYDVLRSEFIRLLNVEPWLNLTAMTSCLLRRPPQLVGLRGRSKHHHSALISYSPYPCRITRRNAPPFVRSLQSSAARRNDTPQNQTAAKKPDYYSSEYLPNPEQYTGPLTQTFRRLKIFSLGSLTLTTIMTPFLFLMETASAVPFIGRCALGGTILATSGLSTALVGWLAKPYVTTLRWLKPEGGGAMPSQAAGKQATGLEMTTMSLTLKPRITRVYDTAFLVPTNRPLAKWELAEAFKLPEKEAEAETRHGSLPREETIAETVDKDGNVLGRWIVKWGTDGVGQCHEAGKIIR